MTALKLSPVVLALLLLAAHFYRANSFVAMGFCIALVLLVFVRRAWAARALQATLWLGSLEWLRAAVMLALERKAMGQPFFRLAVILGSVALLTALCSLVLRAASVQAWFNLPLAQVGKKPSTDK